MSELTGYHRDAGASLGRSFRVGWGPGWTLAHVGQLVSGDTATELPSHQVSLFSGRGPSSTGSSSGFKYSVVSIEKVDASPWMKEGSTPNIEVSTISYNLSYTCTCSSKFLLVKKFCQNFNFLFKLIFCNFCY